MVMRCCPRGGAALCGREQRQDGRGQHDAVHQQRRRQARANRTPYHKIAPATVHSRAKQQWAHTNHSLNPTFQHSGGTEGSKRTHRQAVLSQLLRVCDLHCGRLVLRINQRLGLAQDLLRCDLQAGLHMQAAASERRQRRRRRQRPGRASPASPRCWRAAGGCPVSPAWAPPAYSSRPSRGAACAPWRRR